MLFPNYESSYDSNEHFTEYDFIKELKTINEHT